MAIPVGKRYEDKQSGMQVLVLKGNPDEEWALMAGDHEMEAVRSEVDGGELAAHAVSPTPSAARHARRSRCSRASSKTLNPRRLVT